MVHVEESLQIDRDFEGMYAGISEVRDSLINRQVLESHPKTANGQIMLELLCLLC